MSKKLMLWVKGVEGAICGVALLLGTGSVVKSNEVASKAAMCDMI